jgi:hypothetical protein
MNAVNYYKIIITLALLLLLQSCAQMNYQSTDYSGPLDPLFEQALTNQQWIKDEYANINLGVATKHLPLPWILQI